MWECYAGKVTVLSFPLPFLHKSNKPHRRIASLEVTHLFKTTAAVSRIWITTVRRCLPLAEPLSRKALLVSQGLLAAGVNQQRFSFGLCLSFYAFLFLCLHSSNVPLSHSLPPPPPVSTTFASGCRFNGVWWSPHVSAGSLGLSAGCCLILQRTASDLSWHTQVSPVWL